MNEKTEKAFKEACKKLGISDALPNVDGLRQDLQLHILDYYVLCIIVEAANDGWIADFGDHDQRKYFPWPVVKAGYKAGSGGGGFACYDSDYAYAFAYVGARLSVKSPELAEQLFNDFPELWESVKLYLK